MDTGSGPIPGFRGTRRVVSPQGLVERVSRAIKALLAEPLSLGEIRPLALELYREVYCSGLVSPQFDLGTHRPGGRITIERIEV